jgi:hypothetical protein
MKKVIGLLIGSLLLPSLVHASASVTVSCGKSSLIVGESTTCVAVAHKDSEEQQYVTVSMQIGSTSHLTISDYALGSLPDGNKWLRDAEANFQSDMEEAISATNFDIITFKVTAGEVTEPTAEKVKLTDIEVEVFDMNFDPVSTNDEDLVGFDITVHPTPPPKDSNNKLASLVISSNGEEITRLPKDAINDAKIYVDNSVKKVTINAIAESEVAVVAGNGEYDLNEADNSTTEFSIIVSAENGEMLLYTIYVIKKSDQQEPVVDPGNNNPTPATNDTPTPTNVTPAKQEPTKVVNPKTSVAIPIVLIIGISIIGVTTYFAKHKDKFMKL